MKILIVNWAGLNTGDDIILETCVKQVRSKLGEVEIGLMGHHIRQDLADKLRCKVFGSVFQIETSMQGWSALFKAVQWSDAVIVGGGDIIRERIASFAPFAVASALGRPVCGVGIGVTDRGRSKFWKVCFDLLARSVTSLYLRDENSISLLESSFKRNRHRLFVAPDVAISSLSVPEFEGATTRHALSTSRICINLRHLHDPDYQGAINESATELIKLITDVVVRETVGRNFEILLIPMVDDSAVKVTLDNRDSDLSILKDLQVALHSRGISSDLMSERPKGLLELESTLSGATLVIGARYHFLIGALSTNARIFCVPYANKVKQLLTAIPGLKLLSEADSQETVVFESNVRSNKVVELHKQSNAAVDKSIMALQQRTSLLQRFNGVCLTFLLLLEPTTRFGRRAIGRLIHPASALKVAK